MVLHLAALASLITVFSGESSCCPLEVVDALIEFCSLGVFKEPSFICFLEYFNLNSLDVCFYPAVTTLSISQILNP